MPAAQSVCTATGHQDRRVRLWDPRAPETTLAAQALGGSTGMHTGWISGIAWSPESEFHLFSCALDGEAKVWDVRASVPLHTLKAHDDKVCRTLRRDSIIIPYDSPKPHALGLHVITRWLCGWPLRRRCARPGLAEARWQRAVPIAGLCFITCKSDRHVHQSNLYLPPVYIFA